MLLVELMVMAACKLVAGLVPSEVVDGLRLGRMVALTKPNDIFRRLVSRTLAAFRSACAPVQYALSTRAGALARKLSCEHFASQLSCNCAPRSIAWMAQGDGELRAHVRAPRCEWPGARVNSGGRR